MKKKLYVLGMLAGLLAFIFAGCDNGDGNGGGGQGIPLTLNRWEKGNLAEGGEQWFKFTATADDQYIYVTLGSLKNLSVQLHDSASNALKDAENFAANTNSSTKLSVTSGTEYYLKVWPASGSSGTYTIGFTASTKSPDIFEAMASATQLSADTWANGNLTTSGEQWFKFTATAETQYIHVAPGTLTSLSAQLYNSEGNEMGYGGSRGSYTTSIGTEYYIKASSSGSSSGSYKIGFTASSNSPDTIAAIASATQLSADTWANGNLTASGEQWFKFTATAETQYIHVDLGSPLTSLSAQLYASAGSENATGDSINFNSYTTFASLSVTSGIEYYIKVSSSDSFSGSYKIAFSASPTSPDKSAALALATPLTANTWTSDDLNAGDEHWFKFTATAAIQYIHVSPGTLTNLYVQLHDSADREVGNSLSFTPSNTYSRLNVISGSVYYLYVSSSSSGSYRIAFTTSTNSPDESAVMASATQLTADTWATDELVAGDEHWFKFTATAAMQYIHVYLGSLTSLSVQLHNSAGNMVGSGENFTSSTTYSSQSVTVGTEYYIKVRQSGGTGGYKIGFTASTNSPDTIAAIASATQLTAGTWANKELVAGAEHWFKFTATADTQYIHVAPGTLTSLSAQLCNSAGIALGNSLSFSSSNTSSSRTVISGNVYYIKVWPSSSSGSGSYKIAFNTETTPPGGE
jgi:phosphoheptose isomerase